MKLEQEIFNVLVQAGSQGLKLEKIVRHVYNSCNSIFTPLDYKYVYGFVSQYLIKNSKNPSSTIRVRLCSSWCLISLLPLYRKRRMTARTASNRRSLISLVIDRSLVSYLTKLRYLTKLVTLSNEVSYVI